MKVVKLKDIDTTSAYFNPKIKKHIVLSPGELDNIYSFALAVFPPGEVSRAHTHEDMSEVFIVRSGKGLIRIDGSEFEFTEGMCAVIEPNEVHEIENTGGDDLELLYVEVTSRDNAR